MKLLYKISVRGRVQGVGFRWSAVNEAVSRGIAGYVMNMPDGSVYIEAEGTRDQLESYLKWCHEGPRLSVVRSVDIEITDTKHYTDFRVMYQDR